jgi:hypothetical protein
LCNFNQKGGEKYMKKILFLFTIAIALTLTVTPVMAAKPAACATIQGGAITDVNNNPITVGYDKWGYNYQANMFNGWYDNNTRTEPLVTSGDSLMMKWNDAWLSSKDCDNNGKLDRHYGFSSYRGSGAWLTNHASGTYQKGWDVSGTWNFDLDSTRWPGTYSKIMTIVQDPSGNITGTGGNVPSGQTWNVTGNVTGDSIHFSLSYEAPMAGYVANFVGTFQPDGSMIGTWSDVTYGDSGPWHSTSGIATNQTCEWSDFVKIVAVPLSSIITEGKWNTAEGTEIGPAIWGDFAIIQEISSNPCGKDLDLLNYKSKLRAGLGNW